MEHIQGGGLALGFPTRKGHEWPNPSAETVSLLSGVIATSPWHILTHPPPGIQRWIGGKAALIAPGMTIPAPVNGEVSAYLFFVKIAIYSPL
jgi:acylglycerol lipase